MCCDIVINNVNIKYLYNANYQLIVITHLILLKQTKHVCFGFVRTPFAFMIFLVEKKRIMSRNKLPFDNIFAFWVVSHAQFPF